MGQHHSTHNAVVAEQGPRRGVVQVPHAATQDSSTILHTHDRLTSTVTATQPHMSTLARTAAARYGPSGKLGLSQLLKPSAISR
jgi:hypothetical protein